MTASAWCQRWSGGRHSWRHRSEGGFNRHRYTVAPVDEPSARTFVETHHYSRAWPAARLRYGLTDRETDALVGVVVLGVPMTRKVLTNVFPTLAPYDESLELSRLILLDEVPANAESWFCAEAFRQAAHEGVRGVVAFSDPMPRRQHGQLVMPGHVGTVYQALGAVYTGQGAARTLTLLPDGTTLTARARAKVTGGEQGANGVIARLVALGARPPAAGSDRRRWLADALDEIGAGRAAHPGNHRYAFRIGRHRGERRAAIGLGARTYPKRGHLV